MCGVVGALAAFYPEVAEVKNPAQQLRACYRLIAKMPTLAAMAYKTSIGQPIIYPRNDLNYAENFLHMMFAGGWVQLAVLIGHCLWVRAVVLGAGRAAHPAPTRTSLPRCPLCPAPDSQCPASGTRWTRSWPRHWRSSSSCIWTMSRWVLGAGVWVLGAGRFRHVAR